MATNTERFGPDKWDSIVEQVQESVACDAIGAESPLRLPWNNDGNVTPCAFASKLIKEACDFRIDDDNVTRCAFASKLIKEVYDFRIAFLKLNRDRRQQFFDELRALPFAAQVRSLRTMSRTQMGLVEISDRLFFRWVAHRPAEFPRQLFRCVPDFCEYSVLLSEAETETLAAKLRKLTFTEQAFSLTFIAQASVDLDYIADLYYSRHKPSYRQARKELMRQELGVDVLARYTAGEKEILFADLDEIISELVVQDSKPLRELLQLQNSQNRQGLRDFLHNLLSLQAYSQDDQAITKLVDHHAEGNQARQSELEAIAACVCENSELVSAMLNVFRVSPSHLFDFLGALLDHWTRFFAKGSKAHEDLLIAQGWPELELHKDQEIPDLLAPHTGAKLLKQMSPDAGQLEVHRIAMRRKRLNIMRAR